MMNFIEEARQSGLGENRVGRRISVVTRWYYFLAQQRIGGERVASFAACLTTSPIDLAAGSPTKRFKSERGPKLTNGRRTVPSNEDVDRVLDALSDHRNEYISNRDFALGHTVVNTGLRAMGVHSLTISFFDSVLRDAGLLSERESIGWFGDSKERRDRLKALILARQESLGGPLVGYVKEKRSVIRQVRFPTASVIVLLNFIWGARYRLLRQFGGKSVDAVWLSKTSGNPLALGSVKDILKFRGFKRARIEGSGHLLRSNFLTQSAVTLLIQAKQRFGNQYDAPAILTQLAMLAGHASTDTLQHYLDEAVVIAAMILENNEAVVARE